MHNDRYHTFGTPTPLKICFDCGIEFPWETRAFKGRAHCDDCISLLIQYKNFLPKQPNGIRLHGISLGSYLKRLIEQNFRCKLCKVEVIAGKRILDIDHDHKCCPTSFSCGKCIRGLLCSSCNLSVGHIEKNIQIIDKIQGYINEIR